MSLKSHTPSKEQLLVKSTPLCAWKNKRFSQTERAATTWNGYETPRPLRALHHVRNYSL